MKFFLLLLLSAVVVCNSLTGQIDYDFLERKSKESDIVVIGIVSAKESFWSNDKKMIFTSNKITVYGKIKGNAPDEIEIITYGGEIEDKFQVWSHERTLNLNDKGYFFLRKDRAHFAKAQEYYLLNGENSFIPLPNRVSSTISGNEPALTDKVVEFGFDNIQVLPANKFSFDLLVRTNEAGAGVEFGYGEVLAKYSDLVFGTYVDANEKLEVEKETVISGPNFTLSTEDFSSDIFRTLISGGCNSTGSLLATGIPLTEVFQKLLSITIEIQDLTAIGTISLEEFQMDGNIFYYDPATGDCLPFDDIIYPNPIETGLVCEIMSFSSDLDPMHPDRAAAGTDNILTITGMNFGTTPGSVEFQNADVPGGPLVSTNIVDFTPASGGSWTMDQIKVKIPSAPLTAGTGVFQVRTSGSMVCPSPAPLEICYGVTTFRTNSTNEVRKIYLADYPNDGNDQFSFRLDAGLNDNPNARSTIEMAICNWNERTKIDWTIGDVYEGLSIAPADGVNYISLAPPGVFASNPSANMRTIVTGDRILACSDFSIIPPIRLNHTTDIDIAVREDLMLMNPPAPGGWNFNLMDDPATNQLDFYSIIQHELGHAHLLSHALPNNKKMYPFSQIGAIMRDIIDKDEMGGEYVLDISRNTLNIPNTDCPPAVGENETCAVSVKELQHLSDLRVSPNPFIDEIALYLSLKNLYKVEAQVYDLLGKNVASANFGKLIGEYSLTIPMEPWLSSGIYFLLIKIDDVSGVYKMIKL